MHIGGMICDLAKAFGCVNHKILLVNLHFYVIQGEYEDWFRLYLTNRRQKVEIKLPNSTQNFFSDWSILKHELSEGSILGLLSFIIYINELPLRINSVSEPILFAHETSVIISSRNFEDFYSVSCLVLSHMIKWFAANNLVQNFDKIKKIKFITKNSSPSVSHTGYKEKDIEGTVNTKFIGLQTDNHIKWKYHIKEMILLLSGAYYAE